MALTPMQEKVLKSVRKGQRFNYRELAELTGKSYDAIRYYCRRLEQSGHFVRVSGGGRGVELMLRRVA